MTLREFDAVVEGKRLAWREERALRANQTIILAGCLTKLEDGMEKRIFNTLVSDRSDIDLDSIADLVEESHERARAARSN